MFPFLKRKSEANNIPKPVFIAIVLSSVAIMISLGVARWSWLILDEQIELRKDFETLKNDAEQTNIQYEIWLDRLIEEGETLRNPTED